MYKMGCFIKLLYINSNGRLDVDPLFQLLVELK